MEDERTSKQLIPFDKFISTSKEFLSLLRDLSLVVLAVLFILFPKTLNTVLVEAGFEEGSFVGFKWKAKLLETDNSLKIAQDTISKLQENNDNLLKELSELNARLSDSDLQEKISKLEEENKQLKSASNQVKSSVAETIRANKSFVEKARSAVGSKTLPSAGFCYQEDRLEEGAKRYSVHCHTSQERCEIARGPSSRWKQSLCQFVDLSQADWKPRSGGFMGSWYEFRNMPFEEPFPQIQ